MHHVVVVGRLQGAAHLLHDVDHLVNRETAHPLQRIAQILPPEELHHHVGAPVRQLIEVQHVHDVRVSQLGGHLGLPAETGKDFPVTGRVGVEQLHREGLLGQPHVAGFIHRPHAAGSDLPLNAVGIAEHLTDDAVGRRLGAHCLLRTGLIG